jgi:hypothetical protein
VPQTVTWAVGVCRRLLEVVMSDVYDRRQVSRIAVQRIAEIDNGDTSGRRAFNSSVDG